MDDAPRPAAEALDSAVDYKKLVIPAKAGIQFLSS
jgi:hypothetical protein